MFCYASTDLYDENLNHNVSDSWNMFVITEINFNLQFQYRYTSQNHETMRVDDLPLAVLLTRSVFVV